MLCSLYAGYCTLCFLMVICFVSFVICYVSITRFMFLLFYICFLVLCTVSARIYSYVFSICVQIYGSLPPGRNPVIFNKYHTILQQ